MIKIAIDGPSGSGKSTLAKDLAKRLGFTYVDTGALYRSIGLYMLSCGIPTSDTASVAGSLKNIVLELSHDADGQQHVILNGTDVGDTIRTSEVAAAASAVSALPEVRRFLLDTQRKIAETHNVIMDGRDIGTVIFPDADVKIFLVASDLARAERRCEELNAKGQNVTVEKILEDMRKRDERDSTRKEAPAIPAEDAVFIDTSKTTPEEKTEIALKIIENKLGKK